VNRKLVHKELHDEAYGSKLTPADFGAQSQENDSTRIFDSIDRDRREYLCGPSDFTRTRGE
jgi:hypothetical protein